MFFLIEKIENITPNIFLVNSSLKKQNLPPGNDYRSHLCNTLIVHVNNKGLETLFVQSDTDRKLFKLQFFYKNH